MPEMTYTPRSSGNFNDRSQLKDGWHPAVLMQITVEDTPPTWQMATRWQHHYLWHFLVWDRPEHMTQTRPEFQNVITSPAFSPGGAGRTVAKAYAFTKALLGHAPLPGETINLDSLMPIPCRVQVERSEKNAEYINIVALDNTADFPQIAAVMTDDFKAHLLTFYQAGPDTTAQPPPATASPAWQQRAPAPTSPPAQDPPPAARPAESPF